MKKTADDLLEQLGGMGTGAGASPAPGPGAGQTSPGRPSNEEMDQWRILLIDMIYLLNGSFRDAHYWEGVKAEKDTVKQFVQILDQLNQMPDQDGWIKIVFRGSPGTKISTKSDYVIRFGKLNVDIGATSAVIKRKGIRLKHIEGRLVKSFEILSAQGIETLFLKIPDSSDEALEQMRICLRIASCFKKAVSDDIAIDYTRDETKHTITPMLNDARQPDPNLTMLTALNDLSAENLQVMVQKVSALMKRPDFVRAGMAGTNVYQTIFQVKSLRQRLIRPPIEINSTRSAQGISDQPDSGAGQRTGNAAMPGPGGGEAGSAGGQTPGTDAVISNAAGEGEIQAAAAGEVMEPVSAPPITEPDMDPAVLKASVARSVKAVFQDSPESAVGAMQTIYGKDYGNLDVVGLEGRLQKISDLLASLQNIESAGEQVMDEILERIQAGVNQVPGEVLDDLVVQDDVIKFWDGENEKIVGKADENILDIIGTSKERADTRKIERAGFRPDTDFSDEEVNRLAESFNVPTGEAQDIVDIFKACFDRQNNFQRALFEKKVPEFARYPKQVFAILWEFLKETSRRSDRLPLLNSLQLLVSEIQQPKQAIKVLLGDFLLEPGKINYPDRNAMMLAIQFLRTYNKEINMDIEITPEEVLLVQIGMNVSVRNYVAWKVTGEQKKLVEKIITIRKKLVASLKSDGSDAETMPVRFLLALEREVYMFLALVGGKTATAVINSALKVYGNPASKIYRLEESRPVTPSLLQQMAVLIRGLGRVGGPDHFEMLDEITKRQEEFLGFSEEPRHATQVRRTLGWIDSVKAQITKMNNV